LDTYQSIFPITTLKEEYHFHLRSSHGNSSDRADGRELKVRKLSGKTFTPIFIKMGRSY